MTESRTCAERALHPILAEIRGSLQESVPCRGRTLINWRRLVFKGADGKLWEPNEAVSNFSLKATAAPFSWKELTEISIRAALPQPSRRAGGQSRCVRSRDRSRPFLRLFNPGAAARSSVRGCEMWGSAQCGSQLLSGTGNESTAPAVLLLLRAGQSCEGPPAATHSSAVPKQPEEHKVGPRSAAMSARSRRSPLRSAPGRA